MGAQTNNGEGQFQDGEIELRSENYLFRIREKSSHKVDIEIIDTKIFKIYFVNDFQFATNANLATLRGAIAKTQEKYLKLVIIPSLNDERQSLLKLVLKVSFDFIPHFEEEIILIEREGVSEEEKLQIQLRLTNSDIDSISKEVVDYAEANPEKYVWLVKKGNYSQVAETIQSFKLPKGRYYISVQLYCIQASGIVYLTLKKDGGELFQLYGNITYYLNGQTSTFHPRLLTTVVVVAEDSSSFTLESPNSNSYPWTSQNLVISATKI